MKPRVRKLSGHYNGTDTKMVAYLNDLYENFKDHPKAGMKKYVEKHSIQVGINVSLLHFGILVKCGNSKAAKFQWVAGKPHLRMARKVVRHYNLLKTRKSRAKKAIEDKKIEAARKKVEQETLDYETLRFNEHRKYFFKNNEPKTHVTLVELKQIWEMYLADCSIDTICLYLEINKTLALECIEAAQWHYGGWYQDFLEGRSRQKEIKKKERVYNIYFHDDEQTIGKRPPAIYTNTTPYQTKQYKSINSY